MRFPLLILTIAALASTIAPGTVSAEQHVVGNDQLYRTVARHVSDDDALRGYVLSVLDDPAVRAVAKSHGFDLTHARDAVATLHGSDLGMIAQQATQVENSLVGGSDKIVISSTTVIIVLLILILIAVA